MDRRVFSLSVTCRTYGGRFEQQTIKLWRDWNWM